MVSKINRLVFRAITCISERPCDIKLILTLCVQNVTLSLYSWY